MLDAGGDGSVVTARGTTEDSLVDGFTLRNGRGADIVRGTTPISAGGGVQIALASATISNNVIEDCTADEGGGIFVGLFGGTPEGEGSTIVNNVLRGNTATGSGGGLMLPNGGATVASNLFEGNTATVRGGAFHAEYGSVLANNTIVKNSAPEGGGVFCVDNFYQPTLRNNIVAFNSSGVVRTVRTVMMSNDVFGNAAYDYGGAGTTTGNLHADPLFVDTDAGDYRLRAGSPCRDAGTGAADTPTDLDGAPRLFGPRLDMGAYEFHGTGDTVPALDARMALQIAEGLTPNATPGGPVSILDAVRLTRSAAQP